MNKGQVLLVDDDAGIVTSLRAALTAAGHGVAVACNGTEAIALAGQDEIDVMLLDLGLPDMDGKDVILNVRRRSTLPIIVLSARHQEQEKIASLDCGADDYVGKAMLLAVQARAARTLARCGGGEASRLGRTAPRR